MNSLLLYLKYVTLLQVWDSFSAAVDKLFEDDGEELFECGLDCALDGEALRAHHLETALHHEDHEFLR